MGTIKIIFQFWKMNLLSAFEYKISFFTQVFVMIINDFLFFAVWIFFFKIFKTIGGLDIGKFAILLSIMVMVFGIVHTFFYGYLKIGQMIEDGKLDSHLLLPKNILVRLITSSMMTTAIGDIIYAFLLMLLIPNLTLFMVFQIVFYSIIGSFTFIGFMLIFVSLSFFIGSSKNIVRGVMESLLGPSHYPPAIFDGTILKYIFMTIVPVYFVVFGQFELMLDFNFEKFIFLILGSLSFVIVGISVFYSGLKRYESGNMINTNI